MSLTVVTGDILYTRAQVIGFAYNARARHEDSRLHSELSYRYPAAFASFRKQAAHGKIAPGQWWLWREATPFLALLVVRSSNASATRLRTIEAIAQDMAQIWPQEGITQVALSRIGDEFEWPAVKEALSYWLEMGNLQTVIYETYVPGVTAPEPWDGI